MNLKEAYEKANDDDELVCGVIGLKNPNVV